MKLKDKKQLELFRLKCQQIADSTAINPFETEAQQQERIARAKKDYGFFVNYYLPQYAKSQTPEFHLKAARSIKRNPNCKLWLQWGRGLAKSVVANVAAPLWLWIHNDINFMVLIGQNEDKAKILLGDIQAEFESNQRLIHDFGPQHTSGDWTDGFFKTQNGFIAKAIGMGQDPRGLRVGAQRPDYIACDDWETRDVNKNPKRQDEYARWLLRGVIPTMDNGNKRVLLCNNKFEPRMIFDLIIEGNPSWKVNKVNAYDPSTYAPIWKDKYSKDHYKNIEKEIGSLAANAEYNNDPHVEGKVFTDEMIQWAKLPQIRSFDMICGFWDVAYAGSKTSDFNAVRVWGVKDNNFYLLDCFVKQSKIRPALQWIQQYQAQLPDSIYIHWRFEAQFWNDEIERTIEEVEYSYDCELHLVKSDKPKMRKIDRLLSLHPYYQNSRVYYSDKLKGHNDTLVGIAQLKGIEPGYKGHDDAPDADQQAISYLSRFNKRGKGQYIINQREDRRF